MACSSCCRHCPDGQGAIRTAGLVSSTGCTLFLLRPNREKIPANLPVLDRISESFSPISLWSNHHAKKESKFISPFPLHTIRKSEHGNIVYRRPSYPVPRISAIARAMAASSSAPLSFPKEYMRRLISWEFSDPLPSSSMLLKACKAISLRCVT